MLAALLLVTVLIASSVSAPPLVQGTEDAVRNVERKQLDVVSPAGVNQKLLVTRPNGATARLPAILILPWMDCASLAIPAGKQHGFQIVMRHLVERSGLVVGRVQKPGVGGSAGVCRDTDFDQELAGYRASFQALSRDPWVDPARVVV